MTTANPAVVPADTGAGPQPAVRLSGRRRVVALLAALALLSLVLVLSIAVGTNRLPLGDVWAAVRGDAGAEARDIVLGLRVPRTAAGLAVGAALGLAGALIQALTRNPLADPGILGVNSGAAFAVVLAIGVFGVTDVTGYVWFALAGALTVTVVVYLIGTAGRRTVDPIQLTLAGVAVGAALTGAATAMMLRDPATFDRMRSWNAGAIAGLRFDSIAAVLPFLVVGALLATAVARSLNAIALGDELARTMGVNVTRARLLVVVAVTVLAGGATALAGPIAFVGLMVPHTARFLIGPDQRWILLLSAVLGSCLLLAADIVGRVVVIPAEMPAGVVTAFVGAPVLVLLARHRRMSTL